MLLKIHKTLVSIWFLFLHYMSCDFLRKLAIKIILKQQFSALNPTQHLLPYEQNTNNSL